MRAQPGRAVAHRQHRVPAGANPLRLDLAEHLGEAGLEALENARQDVGAEERLVAVHADGPDTGVRRGLHRPEPAPARDVEDHARPARDLPAGERRAFRRDPRSRPSSRRAPSPRRRPPRPGDEAVHELRDLRDRDPADHADRCPGRDDVPRASRPASRRGTPPLASAGRFPGRWAARWEPPLASRRSRRTARRDTAARPRRPEDRRGGPRSSRPRSPGGARSASEVCEVLAEASAPRSARPRPVTRLSALRICSHSRSVSRPGSRRDRARRRRAVCWPPRRRSTCAVSRERHAAGARRPQGRAASAWRRM